MTIALLAILGAAMGSFVNALVWRLFHLENKKKVKGVNLSIVNGRSVCEHCKHQLTVKDLIPVLSWLSLGGKCRYCKKKIHWSAPVGEVSLGILFAASYINWPNDLQGFEWVNFSAWLVFCIGFLAMFIYDLKWLILPNRIIYPMIIAVLVLISVESIFIDQSPELIKNAVLGLAALGGLFYVLFQVSAGRWIGGGDVKLGIFIGLLLGPVLAYLTLMIASIAGSVITVSLLLTKKVKKSQHIPFGPYLIAGAIISAIWGQQIVDWYVDTILDSSLFI